MGRVARALLNIMRIEVLLGIGLVMWVFSLESRAENKTEWVTVTSTYACQYIHDSSINYENEEYEFNRYTTSEPFFLVSTAFLPPETWTADEIIATDLPPSHTEVDKHLFTNCEPLLGISQCVEHYKSASKILRFDGEKGILINIQMREGDSPPSVWNQIFRCKNMGTEVE